MTRDVEPSYVAQLGSAVRALDRWLGQPADVSQLTADLVNRFLHAQKCAGLACHTRRNRRRMLLTLWRSAALLGLVDPPGRAPVAPVRLPDRQIQAWSIGQVRQLLRTADTELGVVSRRLAIPRAWYWSGYICAAWDTGLRGCDLRLLRREHIRPDGCVTLIQHKTGRRKRVRLRPETIARIDQSGAGSRSLIWPTWARLEYWRRQARQLVDAAGLPGTIGRLRHSSGTAVELRHPGRGHEHLGNSRAVFEAHYFDDSLAVWDRPMPDPL